METKWELDNCPFCGGVPQIVKEYIMGNIRYYVGCDSELCGMEGVRTVLHQLERDAVETWNKRAAHKESPATLHNSQSASFKDGARCYSTK